MMNDDASGSRKWEPIQTKPTLPGPAVCRTEVLSNPEAVRCLVDWPIYCIYACKVAGQFYCTHKDRFEFAKRGETGKK